MIPRLHVNLAAPGYRTARALQAGLVLLLLGSIVYAGWCVWEAQRLAQETAQYVESADRVQAMNRRFSAELVRDGLTLAPERIRQTYARVEFANELVRKRSFSWTRLLSELEEALPARASVQSVRLDFKEGAVRVKGRVHTLHDLDLLAGALEAHAAFHGVRIVTHRFREIEEERPLGSGSLRPAARAKPPKHQIVEFELGVAYDVGGSVGA